MNSGYWVEYLDASPAPGSVLTEGESVTFNVKVRYLLTRTEGGVVQLQFGSERDANILKDRTTGVRVAKCSACTAEVRQAVVVPTGTWELHLTVFVVPDGERRPSGELRIPYRVKPANADPSV